MGYINVHSTDWHWQRALYALHEGELKNMAESPKQGMPTTPLMQGFQNPNEMWDPTPLCTIFRTQWFFVAGPPKARKGRHWPGIGG